MLRVVKLMLTARQLLVFKCIVDEFIETAEPEMCIRDRIKEVSGIGEKTYLRIRELLCL